MQGLWTSIVSASASVKLDAAKFVALGISIGNDLDRIVQRFLLPIILTFTAESLHRWLPVAVTYICRFLGILVSFLLYPYMAVLSTSIRGAFMFVSNIQDFCGTRNVDVPERVLELDFLIVAGLVLIGIPFQLQTIHSELPFVLQGLFFPVFLLEKFMKFVAYTVKSDAEKFQLALG